VKLDAHVAQGARLLNKHLAAYKLAPSPTEASIPRGLARTDAIVARLSPP
jgi:hypothetical protein